MFSRKLMPMGLLALAQLACDPQMDTEYEGEPLAEIVGTIQNEMASPPSEAVVALIWVNSAKTPDGFVGESVPAKSHFPADFSLKLLTEPPGEFLNDYTRGGQYPDERRIGLAWIAVAVPDDKGEVVLDPESAGPLIGLAEDHVLAYVEGDLLPGTFCEALLQGQLGAGYHVLEVNRQSDAEVQQVMDCQRAAATREEEIACGIASRDLFREAPQGMQTRIPVRLVDDIDQLDGANLK